VSNSPQSSAGNPGTSSLVAGNRPPTTGAISFTSGIHPTADRASPCDHDHSGLAVRRAAEGNVCIGHNFHVSNAKVPERFRNTFAQLRTASPRQTNLCCKNVFAADLGGFAGFIDGFAHGCGRSGDSYAQWIRWARVALAQNLTFGIHDNGVSFATPSVHTNHSTTRPDPPGRHDIR
jgi:hypothetical protein